MSPAIWEKKKLYCVTVYASFRTAYGNAGVSVTECSTKPFSDERIAKLVGKALDRLFNKYWNAWHGNVASVRVEKWELDVEIKG